jgi:hypothetical protein
MWCHPNKLRHSVIQMVELRSVLWMVEHLANQVRNFFGCAVAAPKVGPSFII